MIGRTLYRRGLYHIKLLKVSSTGVSSSSHVFPVFQFARIKQDPWHFRLGHLPNERLRLVERNSPSVRCTDFSYCNVCYKAKHRKTHFPINDNKRSLALFDLIHCDIWGPFLYFVFKRTQIFPHYCG